MIIRKLKGLIVLAILAGVVYLLFFSNIGRDYPRPTPLFYVNDFAEVLSDGAADVMLFYGENMYEDTEGEGEGRSQIVVATFMVDSAEDAANYDSTDIYREWKIGENDMGLLVLLYFTETTVDGLTYHELVARDFELGERMEAYLTTIEIYQILDNTVWDNPDINMGTVHMYLELCKITYEKAYRDVFYPMEYDLEYLSTYIDDFTQDEETLSSDLSMGFFTYLLSPFASWGGILANGGFVLLAIALTGGFVYNLGGGGSSSGKGVFTRRR